MPYIKRKEYNNLLEAGNALSNIAYNFSQGSPKILQFGDQNVMSLWRRNWDKAKEGLPKLRRNKTR